jgi:hypothetical protein
MGLTKVMLPGLFGLVGLSILRLFGLTSVMLAGFGVMVIGPMLALCCWGLGSQELSKFLMLLAWLAKEC